MRQYNIKGMSCAACSARVEKAVSSLRDIEECSVNLLTNSMTVSGNATDTEIISAVEKAGYSVETTLFEKDDTPFKNTETPILKRRLIASLGFLGLLMYISMGYTMWGFPLPRFLSDNPILIAFLQLILTLIVMVINKKFFINGTKGIINRSPNMDTLVALGSFAGFIYSTAVFITMLTFEKNEYLGHALHDLYFESSAMILALITLGKMLEARAKGKTTDALKALMDLAPKTVNVIRNEKEITIPVEEIVIGDIFTVKPGESIAVDGIVIEGFSAVDESMLSGESIPIEKSLNEEVFGGTINSSGFLKCKASKIGEDTAISQIIKIVSDSAATKAPIAKVADKVSGIFVPIVIVISLITLTIWLLLGESIGFSLARAISVLVISCPCALGLATPVAIMVGCGKGAKNGILFKNASALEGLGKITAIALDKTGTLTEGKPTVTDIIPYGISEKELLKLSFSLELKSEHPLAKAIVQKAQSQAVTPFGITDFNTHAGHGLEGKIDGKEIVGGNAAFLGDKIPKDALEYAEKSACEGKTPLFFSYDGKFCGIINVADTLKPDSAKAIKELKNLGLSVIMITGDNSRTAKALAAQTNIDTVYSEILPSGKADIISKLGKIDKIAMVGDGINDAPALMGADIGIAVGTGTAVAIDAAEVVVMRSSLLDVCAAIRLSRATIKIIHQNLFWAFIYNCIGIPLAAGLFIGLFDWQLNPMFSAAAMSLSSFCVVSNALRLNFAKLYNSKKDKKIKHKEHKTMSVVTTLKIEGMMCPHCEARVKSVLEELDGVISAQVSHQNGTATVESNTKMEEALNKAVENAGYKIIK